MIVPGNELINDCIMKNFNVSLFAYNVKAMKRAIPYVEKNNATDKPYTDNSTDITNAVGIIGSIPNKMLLHISNNPPNRKPDNGPHKKPQIKTGICMGNNIFPNNFICIVNTEITIPIAGTQLQIT